MTYAELQPGDLFVRRSQATCTELVIGVARDEVAGKVTLVTLMSARADGSRGPRCTQFQDDAWHTVRERDAGPP